MINKELIEKVLRKPVDYWTDGYLEYGFKKEFELVEKIRNFLNEEEFSFLYEIMNENHMNLYRILEYFEESKK